MNILAGVVVALIAAGAWLYVRAKRKYAPLFEEAHLRELVAALSALKAAAFQHLGQAIHPQADHRIMLTTAHVAIVYTAEQLQGTGFVLNHLSLSRSGYYLTWAAGGRFAYVILRQLGVPPDRAALAMGPTGVVHVAFLVPETARDTFSTAAVWPLPADLRPIMVLAEEFKSATLREGRLLQDERQLATKLLDATRSSERALS